MRTQVTILHHEYPSVIRDHVTEKLQHLVRFYADTVSIRAILERQASEHRVELVASVRRGVVFVVEDRADSIKGALDGAVERMGRVLARHKDKLIGEGRRQGQHHRV